MYAEPDAWPADGHNLAVAKSVQLCHESSADGKFMEREGKAELCARISWTKELLFMVGIVEVVIAILFLIPQAAVIGTFLLTAYLGGAVSTHVRINDPIFFPITIGVVAWVALEFRNPAVCALAFRSFVASRDKTIAKPPR